jgi:plastocyanin
MRRIGTAGLVLFAVAVLPALRLVRTRAAEVSYDVEGQVALLMPNGEKTTKDASKVAEWLVPQGASTAPRAASAKIYRMVQQDKRFDPDMLVVPVGSIVSFPNRDPWFHNVFSLYRGKRFDLGLYQAGDVKIVRFDRLGPSYIFCNIHPQMAAVILTVGSEYFGLSDKAGRIEISDVPVGRYRLNVWYENANADALQALGRDVVIKDDRTLPRISISVVPHDLRDHKNKYGQDYDTGALSPNY